MDLMYPNFFNSIKRHVKYITFSLPNNDILMIPQLTQQGNVYYDSTGNFTVNLLSVQKHVTMGPNDKE